MFEELFRNGSQSPDRSVGGTGLALGIVKENWDSKEPGKVKVEYYLGEKGKMVTTWMRISTLYAASSGGFYFLPEVGTEVIIGFIGGHADSPVVMGALWGPDMPMATDAPAEKNPNKLIKTSGGSEIRISDEEKKTSITVTTPDGLSVLLDDEKKTVTMKDKDGKNKFTMNTEKGEITLDAEKKICLSVGGTEVIVMDANQASVKSKTVSAEGSQNLKLKGQSANLQGSQIQIKADASGKVESGGMLEVKGSMVKIN